MEKLKELKEKYNKYTKYIFWMAFFIFLIVIGMQSKDENSANSNVRQMQNADATPKALLEEGVKMGEQFGNQISNYYESTRQDYLKEKAWEEYKESNRFRKMICRQAKQGKEIVLECEFEMPSREKFENLYNQLKGGVR